METLEMQRSQLLASVSHELRNQLAGVIGMIDLTLDEASKPSVEESREMIGLARREAVDATNIIEDLLTTSRMESNGLELAAEVVDIDLEVATIIDHYPAEGMKVHQVGVRTSVLAMVDPVRLRQIFRNLLTNAVRYGGTTIEVTVAEIGPAVHVLVADDGPGVPTGEGESIFLPYRRATNSLRHKGSVGLGLWISRRLARAMGGDLVYRRESERTIFDLRVPIWLPAPTPPTLIKSA
jgi:signal transduction histidine kinase